MDLVLVPGIQGRWEWMLPTAHALSRYFRVITFTLCAEPEDAVDQIDGALDRAGIDRAVICGVSLGGMIAIHYAAKRPERVAALVLASTPGPTWQPDRIQAFCARYGAVTTPVFVAAAIVRMVPEVVRARGGWRKALPFMAAHGARVLTHPSSPSQMRKRIVWWLAMDRESEARSITAPTLIVTGERHLDRVVPAAGSCEYEALIPGARVQTLEATGHIGVITRAGRFAEMVNGFVANVADSRSGGDARGAAR